MGEIKMSDDDKIFFQIAALSWLAIPAVLLLKAWCDYRFEKVCRENPLEPARKILIESLKKDIK
jgi:hypothetical protein